MRIEKKIYETGKKGYDAMVADISAAFAWDEILPKEDENGAVTTFRKKYNSMDSDYVGLRANYRPSYTPYLYILGRGAVSNFFSAVAYSYNGNFPYCTYAIGSNGVIIMAHNNGFPNGNTTPKYIVGIADSLDVTTGESSYCSFLVDNTYNSYNLYTIGKSTQKSENLPMNRFSTTGLCEITLPIISPDCTTDIPKDLLMRIGSRTGFFDSNGEIVFNGKGYYGMGNLLVPMDW